MCLPSFSLCIKSNMHRSWFEPLKMLKHILIAMNSSRFVNHSTRLQSLHRQYKCKYFGIAPIDSVISLHTHIACLGKYGSIIRELLLKPLSRLAQLTCDGEVIAPYKHLLIVPFRSTNLAVRDRLCWARITPTQCWSKRPSKVFLMNMNQTTTTLWAE